MNHTKEYKRAEEGLRAADLFPVMIDKRREVHENQVTFAEWAEMLTGEDDDAGIREDLLRPGARILAYRTKRVKAGDMLYLYSYPIYRRKQDRARAARHMETAPAQAAYNRRKSAERLKWLINANFTDADLWCTFTYDGQPPENEDAARRDIRNYLRAVNRWRKRAGMSAARYVYVIEWQQDGEARRVHHHVIMSGMPRDIAEQIWTRGKRNKTERLQPDGDGLNALTRYITKQPRERKGGKRWGASKGLKQPDITTSDKKVSRGKMERLTRGGEAAARAVLESVEKNHTLTECRVYVSDFMPGAYMAATMHRRC